MELTIKIPVELSYGAHRKYFNSIETVMPWQYVWTTLLDMAYKRTTPIRRIYVEKIDHEIYQSKNIANQSLIEFDYIWKEYEGEFHPVKELEELYVPYELFNCLGVKYLFEEAFPMCDVSFW